MSIYMVNAPTRLPISKLSASQRWRPRLFDAHISQRQSSKRKAVGTPWPACPLVLPHSCPHTSGLRLSESRSRSSRSERWSHLGACDLSLARPCVRWTVQMKQRQRPSPAWTTCMMNLSDECHAVMPWQRTPECTWECLQGPEPRVAPVLRPVLAKTMALWIANLTLRGFQSLDKWTWT